MSLTTTFRGSATQSPPKNPKVYHVAVPLANVEVSQLLNNNTRQLMIVAPPTSELRYSWVAGGTGGVSDEFITLPAHSSRVIDGVDFSGIIYLRTTLGSQTVQLEEWT